MNLNERVTSFQAEDRLLNPEQLYCWFQQRLPTEKKHIYITGPINSGGAFRLHSFEGLSADEIATTIQLIAVENVAFANILIKMLLKMRLIDKDAVVTSPYHLGQSGERRYQHHDDVEARTWTQSEYLLFWSMVIAGVSSEVSTEYYQLVAAKMRDHSEKMNTIELSRAQRIEQYKYMEDVVVAVLSALPSSSYKPIDGLLRFPDSHYSLGSVFEQRLALKLDIPAWKVIFNLGHPYFQLLKLNDNPVFKHLLEVDGGVTAIYDDGRILPIEIVRADDKPEYKA